MAKRLRSEQPAVRSPVWHGLGRDSTFSLQDNCTGTNFFDCFDFFDDADPTHGDVVFVNDSVAWAQGLVSTTASQAFLGVDNTTSLGDNQGRNSVRLGTKNTYDGALFVLDVAHMPFGCATWPAFWTVSQTQPWPLGGEIDIIEGVNTNTVNQMTLHTGPGCNPNTSTSDYTAQQIGTTCASSDGSNAGCGFLDRSNTSYGAGLNAVGGGVFAMHWDGGGVSAWHWTHDDQPSDLAEQSQSPDPTTWGTPDAAWVADGCSPYTYLKDHQAIIETTLCGDWANSNYGATSCPGTCSQAVQDPSNFNEAYWLVNYFSVFIES
ncbi:glycoside hydrolase family 16 protein [Dacryopinax primogenitus]|uniref:Glycoside hydrolase family 16 protein n=1 Tax=Dacryopinax primogenitus (strain DJM 731) TaxID=1858805 RepID=M5FVC6_DACPD|nr:glycoside hydrolase family 16 protein [Dacryopinax primogenitus]EJU00224.1 glycoside hydrolase family 16 protein [Dacryopinax primogenitus]